MKKYILHTLAAVMALCSCSQEENVSPSGNGSSNIKACMEGFSISDDCVNIFDDEAEFAAIAGTTRATLLPKDGTVGSTLVFKWEANDQITVFSTLETSKSKQEYSLNEGEEGKATAGFSAQDFQISNEYNYYAFAPTSALSQGADKRSIELDYSGQRQEDNNSTEHLGKYNYVASYEAPNSNNIINFNFKHLSTPMQLRLAVPKAGTFTRFEWTRSDGETIKYKRTVDLTTQKDKDNNPIEAIPGEDYAPVSRPSDDDEGEHSYVLELGQEGGTGIHVGANAGSASGELLELWMMFPKTDELQGKTLIGKLTGIDDATHNPVTYYITLTGYTFTDNYKYNNKKAILSTDLNISLRVNKLWHVGNTQTRAGVGDPGYDEDLKKPRRVEFYTCRKGKFIWMYPATWEDVEEPGRDIEPDEWIDNGDEWIYNKTIRIPLTPAELLTDETIHVYAVASYYRLSINDAPSAGSDESEIETLKYELTSDIAGHSVRDLFGHEPATDEDKVSYFKNIYTNDYKIGKDDPTAMVMTLYHNFAKLDVQWNNLTGSPLSTTDSYVRVNNVPTKYLYLFQPTKNTSTVELWSPRFPITGGTCWNGRAVFYVPQMENQQYSITIGGTTQTVTFDDAPTNVTLGETSDYGKAAWLKANITLTNP